MQYESTGTIRVVGCAGLSLKKNFLTLFLVGDRAYIRKKARLGDIESVVVKRIHRKEPQFVSRQGAQPNIMYVDTYNRIWEESELLSEEDAVDLARIYWQNIEQEGRRLFEEDGCFPIPPEGCRQTAQPRPEGGLAFF
jgi:hypothetical protein